MVKESEIKELLKKADQYLEKINMARPFNEKELKDINEYFKIGLTYSSNAIEGNTLTLTETKILIEDGLTVSGKPLKDYLEANGHAKAYDFMINTAREKELYLTEDMIKKIHKFFYFAIDMNEAGNYRSRNVYITGTDYIPPQFENVEQLMIEFVKNINQQKDNMRPIELAALAHKGLVDIHPFEDGNGRTARLLMNLILVNQGYRVAMISPILRHNGSSNISKKRKSKQSAGHRIDYRMCH